MAFEEPLGNILYESLVCFLPWKTGCFGGSYGEGNLEFQAEREGKKMGLTGPTVAKESELWKI